MSQEQERAAVSAPVDESSARRPWWTRWVRRVVRVGLLAVLLLLSARALLPYILPSTLSSAAGAFGLELTYEELHLRVLRGDVELWGLRIAPAAEDGVEAPALVELDYLALDVDMGSLMSERPRVRRAEVDGLLLRIDRNEAGQWALMSALEPFLASSGEPSAQEPTAAASPTPLALPVELSALRLHDATIRLSDRSLVPPLERELKLDVRIADLGSPSTRTRLEVQAWGAQLLESARLLGSAATGGEQLDITLQASATGLELASLSPYLSPLGIRPLETSTSLGAGVEVLVSHPAGQPTELALAVKLDDVFLAIEGERQLGAEEIRLEIPELGAEIFRLGAFEVRGARGGAERSAAGLLRVAGIEFVPTAEEGAPQSADATSNQAAAQSPPAAADEHPFVFEVARIQVEDSGFEFADSAVSPRTVLGFELESLGLEGLVFDPARPNSSATMRAAARLPGIAEPVTFDGTILANARSFEASATVHAAQIRLEKLSPYLEGAGITSDFDGGVLAARFHARGAMDGGVLSASANMSELELRVAPDAAPVFAVGEAGLSELKLDAGRASYSLGEAVLTGLRLNLEKDEEGRMHAFGLGFGGGEGGDAASELAVQEGAASEGAEASSASAGARVRESAGPAPSFRLGRLSWSDTRIEFLDRSGDQPFSQVFDDVEAELTDLLLGGQGERAPARFALRGSAGDFAEALDLRGEFRTQPERLDFHGAVSVQASGLSLLPLQPFLAEAEIEPELERGKLSLELALSLAEREEMLVGSLDLGGLELSEGEQVLAAMEQLSLGDVRYDEGELRIGALRVSKPESSAMLDDQGALRIAGVRILPRVPEGGGPARLPRVHELIDLRAVERLVTAVALGEGPALNLESFVLEGAGFGWQDLTVTPVVDARFGLSSEVRGLVLGRAADPATYEIELHIDDTLESLRVFGELMPAPRDASLSARFESLGLHSGVFAGYIPPGVTLELRDGRMRGALELRAEEYEPGEYRAAVSLSEVDFREADAEEPYLALAEMGVALERLSLEESRLELGAVKLTGLDLELERVEPEVFAAFGARVDLTELGKAAVEGVAAEAEQHQVASLAERAGTETRSLKSRDLPYIRLGSLDLHLARFGLLDRTRADAAPVELSLSLVSLEPLVLLDSQPEELPPLTLHVGGGLSPLVGEFDLDLIAEPYIAEPRLHLDARAAGLSGVGLLKLLPELADSIDAGGLEGSELSGSFDVTVRARRRGPTDYDLRSGFGLEFEARDLGLRDGPGGPLLLGVDGVRVDVRRFKPLTGDLHVSEVEILDPQGRMTRTTEGLDIAGLLVRVPEAQEVEANGVETHAELESAAREEGQGGREPLVVDPDAPELRVDRFYVTGMNFVVADEAVTPPMYLPLSDVDVEVRGFSTVGLQEGKPIRFTTLATAGPVVLPKRDAYGNLVKASSGEEPTWPGSSYALESRPAFDEFALSGELRTQPKLSGWTKLELRGLELLNYAGTSKEFGVAIEDGLLDSSMSLKLNERGLAVDATSTFTSLSLSESANGPLRSALKLPAPIDTVIFMTRNSSGENTIPVSFFIPASGLSVPALAATATATVAQVLAASLARSPFRLVGGILDFTGITSNEPVARVQESIDFLFEPGAARGRRDQAEKLADLLDRVRADADLVLILQHEFGGGDLVRCGELANPNPQWCREFAVGLRLEKARLWKLRERAAERVRSEYTMGELERAQAISEELRRLDADLGRTEDALDNVYQLLRPGADRRRDKRTKDACLELARLRLAVARTRLLAELGPEFASRIEVRRPRYAPSEGEDGGMVVVTPKKR